MILYKICYLCKILRVLLWNSNHLGFAGFQTMGHNFELLNEQQIVTLITEGNEEAMLYLLYDKYAKDLEFFAWQYYHTTAYLDDLTNALYIHLKGSNGDWAPLKGFQWRCSLRTWFCSVASHLFQKKRRELIGLPHAEYSIDTKRVENAMYENDNIKLVILMEAINRLQNDDHRFILIKELEGYNHTEIAQMLAAKRIAENRTSSYKGKQVVPDAHYVDMNKARALKEVKVIVEQLKQEL